MALLYRFTKLNDRSNTGIFTFIVTRSVARDLHRDPTTKDFIFGYHRWAITFTRSEKLLGVFLILRNPSMGTKCYTDFSFTLLNREHFSKNEIVAQKQSCFSVDHPAHGTNKWIPMADLSTRRFTDENEEFLIELSVGNVKTVFEGEIKIPHHLMGSHSKNSKFETAYFIFGNFEWNISFLPHGSQNDLDSGPRPRVFLNRLTGFEHPCRVRYRVILGEGDRMVDSGILDQISDLAGRIRGFSLRSQVTDLARRGLLIVHVEMICANTISEAKVATVRDPNTSVNCYDRDKQGWCIESDLEGELVKLKLFYCDLHHVPRNHLRYVSWNAYIIRQDPSTRTRESVIVLNVPHWSYYIQDGVDMGIVMETDIPVRKIRNTSNGYLGTNGQLTVHIEWLESLLLFGAIYHKYDDLCRIHGHQMRREIGALQTENNSLERELFIYQKAISFANSRGHPTEDLPDDYYSGNDGCLDRSLSEGQSLSETEYA
ncbi:uncharacterized protein LOC143256717 [Tachypleus tridentatus]|uniref:uncharacterized protein LOC143256717 n=1 Tax=Tachypleus tridentatus TaxID=6853 RepID=UPI003FD44769